MTVESDLQRFCALAKQLGANDAKPIRTSEIVVADWVRLKCQFGCGGYGERLTCPPHSPTPETTRKVIKEYEWAILIRFLPKKGSTDWKITHTVAVKLETEIFLSDYYKALAFASGPCPYCAKCNLKTCEHSELARPSMEAAGIDVYSTVRKAGFDLHVVKSEKEQPTYFALVLVQ